MDLDAIQAALSSPDMSARISGIKALKAYEADVAVPLLTRRMADPEFLVRSLVAMGLRYANNSEAFAALLELLTLDRDTNVQAEAANSLSYFGAVAIPHLVKAFYQNENWLVRRSILACLTELRFIPELYEICLQALKDEDLSVQESGIDALATLHGSEFHADVLKQLLDQINHPEWRVRVRVARSLKQFPEPLAQQALQTLKHDPDHRVVAAVLDSLV
jgi:HEAT repeat protein